MVLMLSSRINDSAQVESSAALQNRLIAHGLSGKGKTGESANSMDAADIGDCRTITDKNGFLLATSLKEVPGLAFMLDLPDGNANRCE